MAAVDRKKDMMRAIHQGSMYKRSIGKSMLGICLVPNLTPRNPLADFICLTEQYWLRPLLGITPLRFSISNPCSSADDLGLAANWKERFFVLTSDRLSYYTARGGKECGFIDLNDVRCVEKVRVFYILPVPMSTIATYRRTHTQLPGY